MRVLATSFTSTALNQPRCLRTLAAGVDVCVTVTLVDGLVLAVTFHHSMNIVRVVVFGRATVVEDKDEKLAALFSFSEQVVRRQVERRAATD